MSISEGERRVIYDNLEATVGLDAANYLMKMIPYPPANELATRTDIHAETTMLRGEMAELRGDLRTEMSDLRIELKADMSDLRIELKADMSELRTELKADMSELRTELRGEFGELQGEFAELRGEFGELRGEFAELRGEFAVLGSSTKSDILTLEARLDTRFERRFSETRALTVRLFAISLTANAVAVVSAMVL